MTEMNHTDNHYAAPPRGPIEAVRVCFTKYFDFKGRASRSEFWWFWLVVYIGVYILATPTYPALEEVFIAYLLSGLLLILMLSVSVRRLHDTGRGAWHLLFLLLPLIVAPFIPWKEWEEKMALRTLEMLPDGSNPTEMLLNSSNLAEILDYLMLFFLYGIWLFTVFVVWICWFIQKGESNRNQYDSQH